MNTNGNLLETYIECLREINQNYVKEKRHYKFYRVINVFRHYIIYTKEFRANHKNILLDLLNEYYLLALNRKL